MQGSLPAGQNVRSTTQTVRWCNDRIIFDEETTADENQVGQAAALSAGFPVPEGLFSS